MAFSDIPALPTLDFTDEEPEIGETTEFVRKWIQEQTELQDWSIAANAFSLAINTFKDELDTDDVIQARLKGRLTFETVSNMNSYGAPPNAGTALSELAEVWNDGEDSGIFGWNNTLSQWESIHHWTKGDAGQSAYELAVSLGYVGTKIDWIASLKGVQGDQGEAGYVAVGDAATQVLVDQIEAVELAMPAYLKIDDTGDLKLEFFDDAKGDNAKNCTLALQQAIAESLTQESRPISFTHRYGGEYVVDSDIIELPNDTERTLVIRGLGGAKNTRFHVNSRSGATTSVRTGNFIIAGDDSRSSSNDNQDWSGLEISDLAILGDGKNDTAIGFEWRYSGTTIRNVVVEGFKYGINSVTDDAKAWTLTIDGCSFSYNEIGVRVLDHALFIGNGTRIIGGNVGVLIEGGMSQASITDCDMEVMSEALIRIDGGVAALNIIGNYFENGYNFPGGYSNEAFAINRHGTGTNSAVLPAGLIEFINGGVTSVNIEGNAISMQAAPWTFKFVDVDVPEYLLGMSVSGNTIRKSTGGTETMYLFEGVNDGVIGINHDQSNYTSSGLYASYCADADRGKFRELPFEFGLSAASGALPTFSNTLLTSATSAVNYGPKYAGRQVLNLIAFGDPEVRLLVARGPLPTDPWCDATTGAVVRQPV